jgi:GTPase SAR1 family protein
MDYIGDPKFHDAIVIQGSAGCGKSTFTLRLSDHLRREGLRPIRIRLRDVILGKEFYSQMGEALSYEDDAYLKGHDRFIPGPDPLRGGAIFQEELRYGKNHAPLCPYVLILDGWDEISVAVSEGFKQRVKELLLRIRSELLRRDRTIVRVILTGRPSDAVDECTEFFRDETPILTVRILNPTQLPLYAEKLRAATERRPLSYEGVSNWKFPDQEDLKPVFARYEKEFRDKQENSGRFSEERDAKTGVAAVLGYPLLLHFTFRLLAEANINRKDLLESPTTLLPELCTRTGPERWSRSADAVCV